MFKKCAYLGTTWKHMGTEIKHIWTFGETYWIKWKNNGIEQSWEHIEHTIRNFIGNMWREENSYTIEKQSSNSYQFVHPPCSLP